METTSQPLNISDADVELRHFMHMVYGWMSAGLVVTGLCAAYMASDPRMIVSLVHNTALFYGLLIAELGLVIGLAGWVDKMDAGTAKVAFLSYAALTGVSTSVIYLIYTRDSIASTFFLTAGVFGAMSVYGYTTKKDLTSMGSFCMMGLLGLIMASLMNWWFQSPAVSWAANYIGIVVFVGLTAYDSQRIKAMFRPAAAQTDEETKEAISGALALYLDFVNLFLKLLSARGERK